MAVLALTVVAGAARAEMTAKQLEQVQICAELAADGDAERAGPVCRAAREGADQDARHLRRVADGLLSIGAHADAEAAYQRVIALGGGDDGAAAWHGAGKAAAARGAPERALSAFRMASARDGGNPVYHNAIGVMLDLKGDHDVAQAAYRKGLAMSPDHPTLRHNLQISLARQASGTQPAESQRPSLEPVERPGGFDRLVSEIASLSDAETPESLDAPAPAATTRLAKADPGQRAPGQPRALVPTLEAPPGALSPGDRTMRRQALRLGVYASQSLAWRALKQAKNRGGTLLQGSVLKVRPNPTGDGFVLQAEIRTHTGAAEQTCHDLQSRGLTCVLITGFAAS
jgi:tetratricopeptide (TPR) repeat protein